MTPLLAQLETIDYVIIAVIVLVLSRVRAATVARVDASGRLERKLDLLLKHHGIEPPPGLALPSGRMISLDAQVLARNPENKIAAIKLHREDNPGLGLAEAKADVEAFIQSGK